MNSDNTARRHLSSLFIAQPFHSVFVQHSYYSGSCLLLAWCKTQPGTFFFFNCFYYFLSCCVAYPLAPFTGCAVLFFSLAVLTLSFASCTCFEQHITYVYASPYSFFTHLDTRHIFYANRQINEMLPIKIN